MEYAGFLLHFYLTLIIAFSNSYVQFAIALKNIIMMNRFTYFSFVLILFSFLFSDKLYSQITVSGIVYDQQGATIIGAHVIALNSNTYSVTDIDGKFEIQAIEGEILEITMLGMKKISIAASVEKMRIIMEEEMTTLKEVVIVGYGTKKMGAVTGSVVQVKSEEISKMPTLSAIQAIQGKAAGVEIVTNDEPGQNPSIRIRGLGTVLGGRDPLYIIDGIEVASINGLSSSEIEKVDILKDAASLAIYGQKGANGVVVISTKKGKSGKINVNYDSYYSVRSLQRKVNMADSYRFAYYNNTALGSASYFNFNQPYETDWLDEITDKGYILSNYISISGASDYANYYLGFSDFKEEGVLKGTEFKRNNINSRNDYFLFNKNLKISQNINLVYSDNRPKPLSAFTNAYKQSPIVPVKFDNGRWGVPLLNTNTGIVDMNGDDRFNNVANPAAQLYYSNENYKSFNVFGSIAAELKITKSLKFNSNIGSAYNYDKSYVYTPTKDIWLSQNPSSSLADYEATFGNNEVIYNKLLKQRADDYHWNWDNYLTMNRRFFRHNFTGVLGISQSERSNLEFLSANRYNVPEQSNYWSLDLSSYNVEMSPQAVTSNYSLTPVVSLAYFTRVDYDFDDKYLFSVSLRREGTSVFQKSNRWGLFPAFSAGWLLSKEDFLRNSKYFNFLKIRAGYGEVGNSNTGNAINSIVFAQGYNYAFGSEQGIVSGTVIPFQIDPNLTWETMKEYDMGIDFVALQNLLSGTIEVYHRHSEDLILPVTLPSVLSPEPVYVNTGQVVNKGFEVSLQHNKQINEKWSYSVKGNFSFNHNELTKVDNSYFSNFIGGSLGNGQWTKQVLAGEALGVFYVYEVTGFNEDGGFTYSDTRVVAGSYLPKYTGGINMGVNYRNLDFSVYFYGVGGNKIYNGKKAQRFGGENIEYDLLDDFWLPSNPDAENPKPFNDVPLASTYYIEDGAYIRLNNVNLGYTIKKFQQHISKLRIYASATNPFVWTKFSGFSPEIVGSDNADPLGSAGIELDAYPTNKSFTIGLNLQF